MLETTENRNVEIMLDNVGMTYDAADGKKVQALTNVTMDIHKGELASSYHCSVLRDAERRHCCAS